MTPETDAVRVGIAGFLDALDPRVDTILTLQRAGKPIPLKASHLRLVLAALDETDRLASAGPTNRSAQPALPRAADQAH